MIVESAAKALHIVSVGTAPPHDHRIPRLLAQQPESVRSAFTMLAGTDVDLTELHIWRPAATYAAGRPQARFGEDSLRAHANVALHIAEIARRPMPVPRHLRTGARQLLPSPRSLRRDAGHGPCRQRRSHRARHRGPRHHRSRLFLPRRRICQVGCSRSKNWQATRWPPCSAESPPGTSSGAGPSIANLHNSYARIRIIFSIRIT